MWIYKLLDCTVFNCMFMSHSYQNTGMDSFSHPSLLPFGIFSFVIVGINKMVILIVFRMYLCSFRAGASYFRLVWPCGVNKLGGSGGMLLQGKFF